MKKTTTFYVATKYYSGDAPQEIYFRDIKNRNYFVATNAYASKGKSIKIKNGKELEKFEFYNSYRIKGKK